MDGHVGWAELGAIVVAVLAELLCDRTRGVETLVGVGTLVVPKRRGLKHRAQDDTRPVPAHPQLVALLRAHIEAFGVGPDGRLFVGPRGGTIGDSTYTEIWQHARELALTPAEVRSPLAARPYDLRHAAVSTWLNAGVAPTRVAEWAGHSVEVLLRTYAKCIVGQDEIARRRIEEATRDEQEDQ